MDDKNLLANFDLLDEEVMKFLNGDFHGEYSVDLPTCTQIMQI